MTIMEKLRITAGLMNTYANMAEMYVDMGKLKEARGYFDRSLIICKDQSDSHTEAMLLERVAEIDCMENKVQESLEKISKASKVFEEVENLTELFRCEQLNVKLFRMERDYVSALRSVDKSNEIGNSMNDEKKIFISLMQKEVVAMLSSKTSDMTALLKMEKEIPNEEIKAMYYDELSIVSEKSQKAKYQSMAISIYKKLLENTPKYEYELKIKTLL
jgi:tetratricopeptide (TPR) repeat protein